MNFKSIVQKQLKDKLQFQEEFKVKQNRKSGQSDTYTIFDCNGVPILIAKIFDYLGDAKYGIDLDEIPHVKTLNQLMDYLEKQEESDIDIELVLNHVSLQQRCFKRYIRVCKLDGLDCFPELVYFVEEMEINGSFYGLLIEKYINGTTLEKKIKILHSDENLNFKVLDFLKQLGGILKKLSENEVVHRDISPDNIMCFDENYILIDPGMIKISDDSMATKSSMMLGKMYYASPEQYRGEARTVTFTSDLYAIGVIAIEMIIGYNPLKEIMNSNSRSPHQDLLDRYDREIEDKFYDVLEENTFNSSLRIIIKKLIQVKERQRYDSVESFLKTLSSLEGRCQG
ncbi:protein kinase domain-containing protein [Turicibacter sanguinis]|uniref:protein kinase domain-containing protein n=1 Tax=Turicibacter sanguinis TaxID=154288 RepID=UPI0018A8D910|nr:protein kinase [Turicibacter sanguinis]